MQLCAMHSDIFYYFLFHSFMEGSTSVDFMTEFLLNIYSGLMCNSLHGWWGVGILHRPQFEKHLSRSYYRYSNYKLTPVPLAKYSVAFLFGCFSCVIIRNAEGAAVKNTGRVLYKNLSYRFEKCQPLCRKENPSRPKPILRCSVC